MQTFEVPNDDMHGLYETEVLDHGGPAVRGGRGVRG
jgi:hypothetical protein